MKVVSTTISETYVSIQLADNDDPTLVKEHAEFRVLASELMFDELNKLGDPQTRSLARVQAAALYRARELIDAEMNRCSQSARRVR